MTALTSAVHAQQWTVSAQAGRMRAALDPASAASALSVGLGYDAHATGFRLSVGVPTSSVQALRAGASAWTRAALRSGGFIAGLDLAGDAFLTRDRGSAGSAPQPQPPILPGPFRPPFEQVADRSGHALSGQLLPVAGFEGARLHVHARAGLSHYTARFGDVTTERTVRLADVQLSVLPVPSVAILPLVRRHEAEGEDPATYAGVSAVLARGPLNVWGSAGQWLDVDGVDMPWSIGASARITRRARLETGMRRDTFDPLFLQPPQTSWSVGLSLQVGGPLQPPAPPVPTRYADGRATVTLPLAASPEAPSIAGDFNGWKPAPMQRSGTSWTYTVAVEPGVYNYAFVRADGTWFVPESVAGRRDDGMGGHVAVLVVQ